MLAKYGHEDCNGIVARCWRYGDIQIRIQISSLYAVRAYVATYCNLEAYHNISYAT